MNCCDLLKNSYLCLLNNTSCRDKTNLYLLWFAEKFVSLLIEQHQIEVVSLGETVVICWKIRIFAYWTTPVPSARTPAACCDLLKNSYLCLLNNTGPDIPARMQIVVICWKIRIFAYWTTPSSLFSLLLDLLWFAEKFVSLLIEQHPTIITKSRPSSCDLLKNSYLCLLNNTISCSFPILHLVVICWKIRIFAYWTTPYFVYSIQQPCCDLLKNSYLCLLNNTPPSWLDYPSIVVICWKIRIFAYWTTPD